ncbi:Cof-type HAD-IIB family hydrolase [Aerococcus viridans]|uniref:Cof-type HAD-IIB family hydrolase n=1 Tax=Aerococcus viridans TaxID=1377 RepID=UPI0002E591E1|nr:Cof-type HAD-IIB family hydrolase [Aerococcus viridans]
MTSKYIFLDVDGTLVSYENVLPESAVEAIHQAQANGHKVFTVTGRSKAEMYKEILDIGFDGYVGGNGNYIELADEVIYHKHLTGEETRKIVDWLLDRNLEFYLESNSGLYGSKNFRERSRQTVQSYVAYKGKDNAQDASVESIFPEMFFDQDLYRDDINKISFVLESYQDYLAAKEAFKDYQVGTWGGRGEHALFGDVALANITKETAIQDLLAHENVDPKDTFAFGDAKIDIPMFNICETGVAMGNGGDEIKAAADYITDAAEDDGLYNAFKHFGLI